MFYFAPSWSLRKKDKVQKFDYPDQELFKPVTKAKIKATKIKESHSLKKSKIFNFDEFVNKNEKL